MSLSQKIKHFFGAIKTSLFGIVVCLVFLSVIFAAYQIIPAFSENQFFAAVVGVLASLIASVLFNISIKYSNSKASFKDVLRIIGDSCIEVKTYVEIGSFCDYDKARLWGVYMQVCSLSCNLTSFEDYNHLVLAFKKLVTYSPDSSDKDDEKNLINKANAVLEEIRKIQRNRKSTAED